MPQVGDAFIDFRGRTDKMVEDVKSGATAAGSEIAKNMAIGGLAVEGVTKSVDYLKDAWKSAADAAKGERQTEAVLKSTGDAAGVTAAHVTELAKALEGKDAIDREQIRSNENLLLTFAHLHNEVGKGNDVFDRTVAISLDMSKALGIDAHGAALKLGKALDSPIEGTAALVRVGVRFTEQQKEQIKTMVESGDTLGAQRLMLDEYTKRFGGSAAAQATAADRAKIALENMSRSIGTAVIPVVETVSKGITVLANGMQELPGPVMAGGVALIGLAAGAVAVSKAVALYGEVSGTLGPILGSVTGATARKAAADEAAAAAALELAAAEEAEAVASVEAGAAMSMAIPVVGVLIAAVGAGIAIWHRSAEAKKEQREAIKSVEAALYDEAGALKEDTGTWDKYLAEQSKFHNTGTKEELLAIGENFAELHLQLEGGQAGWQAYGANLVAAKNAGKINEDQLMDLVGAFQKEAKAQEESAKQKLNAAVLAGKLTKEQVDEAVATASATDKTNAHIVAMQQLAPAIETASKASADMADETDSVSGALYMAADRAGQAQDAYNNLADAAKGTYGAVFGAADAALAFSKATDTAKSSAGGGGGAMKDAAVEADKLAKAEKGVVTAEEDLALAVQKRILIQAGPTKNQVAIAEIEARQRTRELTAATNEAADAAVALAEAQKSNTGAAIAHAEELAQREVAAADRDVVRATLAVEDAQKKLNDARTKGDPEEITKAELDLADAQDNVVHRTDAAKSAHDHLRTAQGLQEDAARKAKDAADKLEGAQDHVTTAAIAQEDAQKKLTETNNIGKEGSQELKDANDAVEAAQLKVAEAHAAVVAQEKAMNDQRGGGGGTIDSTKGVFEKTMDVASAGQAWIDKLLAMHAPQADVDDALKKIAEKMHAVAGESGDAQTASDAFLDSLKAKADLATLSVDALAKAAAGATLGYVGKLPDVLANLNTQIANGTLPAHARGGQAHRGLALVGEEGPELVQFGGDAAVFPNNALMDALGGMGGGDTVIVQIGSVNGTRNDAEMFASVTSSHVARALAGRRARFDLRGNR